jgi:hypothetical protein
MFSLIFALAKSFNIIKVLLVLINGVPAFFAGGFTGNVFDHLGLFKEGQILSDCFESVISVLTNSPSVADTVVFFDVKEDLFARFVHFA